MTFPEDGAIKFYLDWKGARPPSSSDDWVAIVASDNWDDWGKYCTQYFLTLYSPDGESHDIGALKIGQRGLKPEKRGNARSGYRRPEMPSSFQALSDESFSLGQDEDYYLKLTALGDEVRENVLQALRDVAYDPTRWEWAKSEYVTEESLLRSLTSSTVEGQFRRLARGDARVTPYSFSYLPPKRLRTGDDSYRFDFRVDPESALPTNLHVLIGRNGVGKTRLLSLMTKALVAKDAVANQSGRFDLEQVGSESTTFANLVAVSFSAFDDVDLLPDRASGSGEVGFSYIGLRGWDSPSPTAKIRPKSPAGLAADFVESLKACRVGSRKERWINVIQSLQSDPVFKAAELERLIESDDNQADDIQNSALNVFSRLSSGHKIVLLTLTRIVEKVEERSLVLIDEPEAHLHPPLLSAMTRTLSQFMVRRNGVAIVATHSPIVLQEVPKSCVWILDRTPTGSSAVRPAIETFGEGVGILTREVFQLELTQAGFHKTLSELRANSFSFEQAVAALEEGLGSEGRAVLRGLFLNESKSRS